MATSTPSNTPASEPAAPTGSRRRTRTGVESAVRTAQVWESVNALAADLQSHLGRPLRVLDLGGGTGGLAVALAAQGHDVTVVDPSPDALAALARRAADAGLAERIHAIQGDAANLAEVHPQADIDLLCCHGVLEVVDDPQQCLAAIADVLAPGGQASIVVAQRLAVVLARALAGQFGQAQHALTTPEGRWGSGDPLPRRVDQSTVSTWVESAGLEVVDAQGVRIFSDLVPAAYVDSEADRMALLDLERAAAAHPEFSILTQLGAALHVVAARP